MNTRKTKLSKLKFLNKQSFQNILIFFVFFFGLTYFFSSSFDYKKNILNAAVSITGYLIPNTTGAFVTDATQVSSLDSNGFSLGTGSLVNISADNYIAWAWGDGAVPGVQVVEYTGTGVARTVSHNLGSAPEVMIVRRRDAVQDWPVYHEKTTNTSATLLNSTNAVAASSTVWNNTTPNASTFTVGTSGGVNTNGGQYTALLFNEVAGFSDFSSYRGTGSADGPFIHTGFKPALIIIKRTDTAGENWYMYDTTRDSFNVATSSLIANTTSGKYTVINSMDILSNGFKIRNNDTFLNASAGTYIYMAFAESPVKSQFTPSSLSIASSTMFDGSTQYLTEPGATTDVDTYTISFWVKRAETNLGASYDSLVTNQDSDSNGVMYMLFDSDDHLAVHVRRNNSTAVAYSITTGMKFRDTNKWYHIVHSYDGTTARLYVDGKDVTYELDSTPATYANQQSGGTASLYRSGNPLYFGRIPEASAINKYNGYLAEFNVVDGQALDATSFGEYDANCQWHPKTYSGAYGTNGIRLTFADPANPGTDSSGNGNNLTPTGFDTTDGTIDSPTNNFSTANYLDVDTAYPASYTPNPPTFSNGNTKVADGSGQASGFHSGSLMVPASGNWYVEIYGVTAAAGLIPGVYLEDSQDFTGGYRSVFGTINNGTPGTAATWGVGSVMGLHINNGVANWYKNNVFQSTFSVSGNISIGGAFSDSGGSYQYNFGQFRNPTSTATSLTYDSSAGGYFVYTPPTGAKAISTANLSAPAIADPADYFDIVNYQGTGAATSSTVLDFQPALLWIKNMTNTGNHGIFYDATNFPTSIFTEEFWFEL